MDHFDDDRLLKPDEAAKWLGVSRRHLDGLIARGAIRYIDVGRGKIKIRRMFARADLADFVESRRRVVPQPVLSSRRGGRRNDPPAIGFSALVKQMLDNGDLKR